MIDNIRHIIPAPFESRISSAEAFGYSTAELRALQGNINLTFEDMITSGEHDDALERFKSAFEFRAAYNFNVESGKVIDRPDGLVQALDNMMLHINRSFFGLAGEHRRSPVDDIFKQKMILGMQQSTRLNRGIIALASKFRHEGHDLAQVDKSIVRDSLADAMKIYWDRTGFPEIR